MPFDAMTMAAVADEVQSAASEGRIQRILQPSVASVAMAVYANGRQHWLVLSADPQYARVYLSPGKLAKAFPTPSAFVMLLRKHLEGARLRQAWTTPGERVLTLDCWAGDQVRLIAEVMGRHSNIILVGPDDTVLGAVKIVSFRQSSVRPIAPGLPYRPPPPRERDTVIYAPGPRIDPSGSPGQFLLLLNQVPAGVPITTSLMGLLPGANPFLCEQIALRAGASAPAELATVDRARLAACAGELLSLYKSREWSPCTFKNDRKKDDFAPYVPLGVTDLHPATSMSAAVGAGVGDRESHDAYAMVRRALLDDIARRRRSVDARIASLREGLTAASEADRVMEQGQMVLAYGYSAAPGDTELEIPDLELTIPLNARMSPAENAERLFKRYRKLRDARVRIPVLLRDAERDAERLADTATFVRLAESEAALNDIRNELEGPTKAPGKKPEKGRKPRGPARFRLNGVTAIVGRNARENEEVTFRLARRDDLWLHARQRTGAHVVLQNTPETTPDILEAAARLAAYFSEGRNDTRVDVDVTPVRNVRKIPGGPPGRVTYSHFQTLHVEPSQEGWAPARA